MRKMPEELDTLLTRAYEGDYYVGDKEKVYTLLTLYAAQVYADGYDDGERDGATQHHEEHCPPD